MQHPFPRSNFKIKDQSQIKIIQDIGLQRVRYDPMRSDCEPLSTNVPKAVPAARPNLPPQEEYRVDRAKQLHQAIHECERDFIKATGTARLALRNAANKPHAAAAETEELVNSMVDSVLTEGDVIIQAMDGSRLGDDTYFHPLNVTVLALMLAKSLDVSVQEANYLGLAALFHDVGKGQIPDTVLMNDGELTKAEQSLLQEHVEFSANLAREAGMPERVIQIIMQHHERVDGSGYPAGLKGNDIDPLARLLTLVNAYDGLCNPINPMEAMTPYGALSYLFASERKKFDAGMLNLFIKSLGVYPPGSIVLLNDGVYGIVVSVNPQKLLRPFIMVHDRRVERDTPHILDLGESTDTSISKCLRADELPKDVSEYLQCRQKLSYYFRSESNAGEAITS
ncbi:MAG: HD-GYP domain-containing protein [Methylophilales bacterium]|nr:HD-GYP domain-containing protein [Methylophilales bacterium]